MDHKLYTLFIYIYVHNPQLYEFSTVCSNENETIVKCKKISCDIGMMIK